MLKLLDKDLERFWVKVDKTDYCWNWTAAKSSKGYGRFKLNQKLVSPHVLSYQIHNDDYDFKKDVCHICDNPSCVNPDHLFLGSRSDNMKDCVSKSRNYVPNQKGEANSNNKLSTEDIKIIHNLYPSNSIKSISQQYNVAYETIRRIIKGKSRING